MSENALEQNEDVAISLDEAQQAQEQAQQEGETADVGGVAGARLKAFIERIERLEEEKKAIAEDVKEVYGEAKATGFEPKIIRKIISTRKIDLQKRREENELLELYMAAIGMME